MRIRLIERLDTARDKRLILIRSPSGFGKTSLAAAWARRLEHAGNRIAWLNLDQGDDMVVRFLQHMMTAIERACPDAHQATTAITENWSMLSMTTVIGNLINALSGGDGKPLFLFLDDYHCLEHAPIHDAIAYLLQHAPDNFHLVLTSCSSLPFPVAKLRARNELLELDTLELGFDLAEIEQFLHLSSKRQMSTQIVNTLQQKTGGWIAALNLASRGLNDAVDPERYVAGLSASTRDIDEYLTLIWDGLPPAVRNFMLQTSILDRLTAPLCNAVTGMQDAQKMLESISKRHLLLLPLDNETQWFRHHNLMSDFLRRRLHEMEGEGTAELHRKASGWYAAHNLWTNAIAHAIAAGDREHAAAWIESHAIEHVRHGDLTTVLEWYRQFPEEVMRFSNRVRLSITWAHLLASRKDEAIDMLGMIEQDIECNPETDPSIRWECRMLRAGLAHLADDDSASLLAMGLECLRNPIGDPWLSDAAGNAVRYGYLKSGDFKRFRELPWFSTSDPKDVRTAYPSYYRLFYEGMFAMQQARFATAERHYWDAHDLAERHFGEGSVEIALMAAMIAEALYEQNRIDDADAMLNRYFERINEAPHPDPLLTAYRTMIRIQMMRKNFELAYFLAQKGIDRGRERNWVRVGALLLFEKLKCCLAQGRLGEAEICAERIGTIAVTRPALQACSWSEIHVANAHAQACVKFAQGNPAGAAEMLGKIFTDAAEKQDWYLALRTGPGFAVTLMQAGETVRAREVFEQVLAMAIPAAAARIIADQGESIRPLLDAALYSVPKTQQREEILQSIIELLRTDAQLGTVVSSPHGQLSAREKSILDLVAGGQSNKQIAKTLGITAETVKTHLRKSFVKLNVMTRAQAVGRLLEMQRGNGQHHDEPGSSSPQRATSAPFMAHI